ncbi:MAG: FliG C-terminal domain-containing protein, partial [Bdellovibrionota bacterium]
MGMLDRYQKTGGFVQLVSLLETCGQVKQEKFLEIIRNENSVWAEAIKAKLLSIEKIYSWNDDTLAEIFGTLQDLTVAVALYAGNDEFKTRIYGFLSHGRRRKVEDLLGTSNPTPTEIATMHMKIVESVRKMAVEGSIRFDRFDPSMFIDDAIEDKLNRSAAGVEHSSHSTP